ncbi:MAG: hypothetical protein F4029_03705 [Gammaproteobacteria bacterium]|nr:hypothetical protein [Gammaproteobacteria bacterium]MYF27309.1 hypothetical protein [Gammaproteobacteria bacterium]MYK45315.1 hypothetical protein [Gammaproteobacteria bacterium]
MAGNGRWLHRWCYARGELRRTVAVEVVFHRGPRRRNIARSRLFLAPIVGALVVVAGVVVWWAGQWGSGISPASLERPVGEPLAGQTPLPAKATLAGIAGIADDFSRNAAIYRLADGASRKQIEDWLAEAETLPPSLYRYDIARVLYIRFAVLDPEAALDHALWGATKPVWLEAIFRTWAQVDPHAATDRAAKLDSSAKAAASRTLLQLGLPFDELRSVAERLDAAEDHDRYRGIERIIGVAVPTPSMRLLAAAQATKLGRRDDESHADAWYRAIAVEDDLVRQILAERIAIDWASEGPIDALAAVKAWPTNDLHVTVRSNGFSTRLIRQRIRSQIVWKWADDEPLEAFAWLMAQNVPEMRGHVEAVMSRLTQYAPEEAIARLGDVPDSQRPSAAYAVLGVLAGRDIDQAMSFFASLDISSKVNRTHVLRRALLANRSAKQALDWAVAVDPRIRADEVAAVIRDLHKKDHTEALRLLESLDEPSLRIAAADEVVRDEARRDAQESLAWVRNFEPEAARSNLIVKVFDTWAARDPAAACRELFDMRGGPVRDQAAATMMPDVVSRDAPLAERLFDAIESPHQQARAAQPLHRHFSDIEPDHRKAERYGKYLPDDGGDA